MKIFENDAMLLRKAVGTALSNDADYELATAMDGSMLIKSEKTGRTANITWQHALELAIAAGIDKEPT